MLAALLLAASVLDVPSIPATPIVPGEVILTLGKIEAAGDGLEAFTSSLAYRKDDALLGSREIRTGTMVFDANGNKSARLAVVFDSRIVNRRKREETKRIVFDGRWLIESDESAKQFIKREVVAPGDTIDPMRLGGPFPLPIGQKRADVLRRFDVTMITDAPDAFVVPSHDDSTSVGIRLVPLEGTPEARDWKTIELWYDPATWLPVGVQAVEHNGDTRRIRLGDVRRNPELDARARAMLSVEVPGKDWSVDIQPWTKVE